jgi:hypothetical protein
VHVVVARSQVQPVPVSDVGVKPAGGISVTLTTPLVVAAPALLTVSV